ncbi:alpha-glucosidase [Crepidotus variabilis]|uniref:Probable alpha/beta-glucosidase agdC n=1 Tax=Crepidotus variabilis TaxID=179855 RepID=A0A9P6JPQ4_9AGAR|nr:alpha-glucosidase [Crepidotus variabilis]
MFTCWAKSEVAANVDPSTLDNCVGYNATDIEEKANGLSANLVLAGEGCNVYGDDILKLSLNVVYETDGRIHVKIVDPNHARYEVPEAVLPRPQSQGVEPMEANIGFNYTVAPFSFSIFRRSNNEILFSTASHPIIFEPQYLRVKTNLPANPNIYGLGEHSQTFRIPPDNTVLTLWSRESPFLPVGTSLYGNHPIYFEHRTTGTHGVFFLNSNGMDIKLNKTNTGASLEYNAIGGILDFYFLAGSETDPTAVAKQYAELVGLPAEVPYWSFGFHQCRYGYQNYIDVAAVVSNYSVAKIPLETMWTDIDCMDRRRIFTVDLIYFPLNRMREIVDYLHSNNQRYIMMTDPGIAYVPDGSYGPYARGHDLGVFMKLPNGTESLGIVWPGVTVWPDWFHPDVEEFWTKEFATFYDSNTGVDIDGVWIDMNEPSNACNYPCDNPFQQAKDQGLPPPRKSPAPDPNAPIFTNTNLTKRDDYLNPPYAINDPYGPIAAHTGSTEIVHANGLVEYNTHNLFGTMMSMTTRKAMEVRRPGKRTLIITRSTFAGAGAHVGKWLGDNGSSWDFYLKSIAGMLGFASVYQVPMIGSDICGFNWDTNEKLCARWATLGAFYPFMRNHNADDAISQEFYRWPSVTAAAQNAIAMRYRLLDYLYTAFHQAHFDGTPVLHPLWFKYPKDTNTFGIDVQFFFGDSILVSPVTTENSMAVDIYLPKDIFYDFNTLAPVIGSGATLRLDNITYTQIPVHIKSGTVLPLRVESQMTTTDLRKTDFELIIAPDANGQAKGQLYFDDGESIVPEIVTTVDFMFSSGKLVVNGSYGYKLGVNLARVRFLNVGSSPLIGTQSSLQWSYNATNKVLDVTINKPFDQDFTIQI